MSGRRRWRHRLGAAAIGAVVVALGASAPALAAYGPPGPPAANPAVMVPLAGAVTTSQTTWATVVMGRNDGDFDLFWQLFAFNPKSGKFALVTPPGVADNGGLMVAPAGAGSTALVGFGVSQGLKFSPLALGAKAGASWSPGGLPDALLAAPSVLSFSANGSALALTGGSRSAVLSSSGAMTSWKTLVTKSQLSATPAGKTCVIGSLEAVALGSGTTPLVGTTCREPYTPGVFVDSDRQWHLADIPVPSSLANDEFATLRLGSSSAIFGAVHDKTTSLVAAWEANAGRPWTLSPALALGKSGELLASGEGTGTEQFVVVRVDGAIRAEVIAGPGARWQVLPTLPKKTATIAVLPTGRVDALSVADTKLSVWQLASRGRIWTRMQKITVPIAFGSSS